MKANLFVFLFYALTVFSACKKSSSNFPQGNTYLMVVKEYKTNIPLAGVRISLYRCSKYDNVFGCQAKSVFATRSTDQNGEYNFTQSELNQANEGMILSKSQYWDLAGGGQGDVFMEPEAMVNLTLRTSKSYPDTSIFELKTTGELGNASFKTFRAPKDSSFNYRLFGNETNTINWVVYTKELRCYQYCIRDTLAHGSLTLNPQRFETLNTSIDY